MPLYVYSCCSCGKELEKLEPYSAPLVQQCPNCLAKKGLVRKISVSNFSLSGDCWFKNGYTTKKSV